MLQNNYLPTDYQNFIALSRYARWKEEEGRRESWDETVDRYIDNIVRPVLKGKKYKETISELRDAILGLQVMPSMRALMTAGAPAQRDNTCIYNCSYLPVDHPRAFDEAMFILLCGTGVGFSVEREAVSKLPIVPEDLSETDDVIVVPDSKEGWARSYRKLISMLYLGDIPKWDLSKIRPAGARLKTFGGRASGPGPLDQLFHYTVNIFKNSAGRQLTPFECHSLMCKVGEIVVVGGVRRSAMISLSNLQDDKMRSAKSGDWWTNRPEMALANNSVCYTSKPDMEAFLSEWKALVESKSGERGIFSRAAAKDHVAKNGRRNNEWDFGTNPCSEIILRPHQFCNLTEVVVRATDTEETLANKVFLATVLGTVQSNYTYFPYLRSRWETNTAEERLLGVSLTGIMDNDLTSNPDPDMLERLKEVAVVANQKFAKELKIKPSAAITCVKPSGTVSQLVDSASGIHARHSAHYVRTVRADNKDPLTAFLIDQGVPSEPCVMKPDTTTVFSFPITAPAGAVTRTEMSSLEQLEVWKRYAIHWCEHKPSVTISVRDDDWLKVGAWVYDNFDLLSGISFLPQDNHTYQQAPYQECEESVVKELTEKMPTNIVWSLLSEFDREEAITSTQTLACSGDSCEVVDLT